MAVSLEINGDVLHASEHLPRGKTIVVRLEGQADIKLGLIGDEVLVSPPHCGPNQRLEVVVGETKKAAIHELLRLLPVDFSGLTLAELDAINQALPSAQDADNSDIGVDMQVLWRVLPLMEELDARSERLNVVFSEKHKVRLDEILALVVGPHVLLDLKCLTQHLVRCGKNRHVLVVVLLHQFCGIICCRPMDSRRFCPEQTVQKDFIWEVLLEAHQ
mmetsp:Transcript_130589/g.279243  ORF Transcript_130589/g.279243 Transcript_130589/m.279243 type:complete len:217 (+) Transcript_130589:2815-3465(+)